MALTLSLALLRQPAAVVVGLERVGQMAAQAVVLAAGQAIQQRVERELLDRVATVA
jgi:hypothetical protein